MQSASVPAEYPSAVREHQSLACALVRLPHPGRAIGQLVLPRRVLEVGLRHAGMRIPFARTAESAAAWGVGRHAHLLVGALAHSSRWRGVLADNAAEPALDYYRLVYDFAKDCVNQGGISNVLMIQPPGRDKSA